MKIIKKILRFIAILLPCYCLAAAPGVSAKSYDIDSFLAHGVYTSTLTNPVDTFPIIHQPYMHFTLSSGYTSLSDWLSHAKYEPRNSSFLRSHLDDSYCKYESYNNPGYELETNEVFWGSYYLANSSSVLSRVPSSSNLICNTFRKFGLSPVPEFSTAGVPANMNYIISEYGEKGYNFLYGLYYFHGHRNVDGVDYDSDFVFTDLFTDHGAADSDPIFLRASDSVRIGLNFDSSLESLSTDTLYLNGSFNYPSVYDLPGISLTLNSYARPIQLPSSCAVSRDISDSLLVHFSCSFTPNYSQDSSYYGFDITFTNNGFNSYYSEIIKFNTFSLVLNGDSSPGGYGGFSNSGSHPNVAPGMPDVGFDSAVYLPSFTGSFDFSFLNPFDSIFGFFQAPDHCVSIPHLASWLHVSNSQVCPLYPSPVYMLLTPVFGAIPIMVIFSYAIKWLRDDESIYVSVKGGKA